MISVRRLADLLLDESFERDGVTILGGESFAQPDGLFALVRELRSKDCPHIVCYSGYTVGALREKAIRQPSIGDVLDEIDILIHGANVESCRQRGAVDGHRQSARDWFTGNAQE